MFVFRLRGVKIINFIFISSVLFSVLHSVATDFRERPCPDLNLPFGKVRLRSRGRVAKFKCDPSYQLVGNKTATCIQGIWDTNIPLCIRNDCPRMTKVPKNGYWIENFKGASYTLVCRKGYVLQGTRTIYCYKRKWSDPIPLCAEINTSCDFEDMSVCGWTQDTTSSLNWTRFSNETPSSHLGTGPTFDHTFGEGVSGYYMYIEASSPHSANDSARLISPVYEAQLSEDACFVFWYHMYGATTGELNIYQKFVSDRGENNTRLFHKSGNQGNKWFLGLVVLGEGAKSFQIIIEAIPGSSYLSDIAIDDLELKYGEGCKNASAMLPTKVPTTQIMAMSSAQTTERRTTSMHLNSSPVPSYPTSSTTHPLYSLDYGNKTTILPPTDNISGKLLKGTSSPTKTPHSQVTKELLNTSSVPSRPFHFSPVSESYGFLANTVPQGQSFEHPNIKFVNRSTHSTRTIIYFPESTEPSSLSINTTFRSLLHKDDFPLSTTTINQKIDFFPKYQNTTKTPILFSSTSSIPTKITHPTLVIKTPVTYVMKVITTLASKYKKEPMNASKTTVTPIPERTTPRVKSFTPVKRTVQNAKPTTTSKNKYTTSNVLPQQKYTARPNISPLKQYHQNTSETPRVTKESTLPAKVSQVTYIAGTAGGIAVVAICIVLIIIITRHFPSFKKHSNISEDSDVRFLTSDEVLDFTLARPCDEDL